MVKNGVGDSAGEQLWGEKLILSRGFAASKRFITSIKSLGEGVFRRLEGDFGHVIPEAGVVFVHFSSAGFQRGRREEEKKRPDVARLVKNAG
jgi:hypothetical protein